MLFVAVQILSVYFGATIRYSYSISDIIIYVTPLVLYTEPQGVRRLDTDKV